MSEGIKEYLEVQDLAISIGNSIDKALADKKINILDLPYLMEPMMKIGPAFEGIEKVGAELKDLDAAEMAQIVQEFNDKFDLKSDKSEMIIEAGHKLIFDIVSYVKMFKDAKK